MLVVLNIYLIPLLFMAGRPSPIPPPRPFPVASATYRDPYLSVEKRADDLLTRMTREEKAVGHAIATEMRAQGIDMIPGLYYAFPGKEAHSP